VERTGAAMPSEIGSTVVSSQDLAELLVDTLREVRRVKLEATVFRELAAALMGRCWMLEQGNEGLRRALDALTPSKRRRQ